MNILKLLEITKGTLTNKIDLNIKINKFKTNSKEIKKGDCFIAISDKYIKDAVQNGASVIITQKKDFYKIPTILIHDIIKTMGLIASYIREKYNPKVIAITGSVGKTTTKELIYNILKNNYTAHHTPNNYNNHIGVPLTIFDLKKTDEIAIIEMGMNHQNEIKYLSKMIKPDIAVITNIGSSHIGNLGSKENILKAKLEIKEGLKGPLFVNGDDEYLKKLKAYKSGFNANNDLTAYNLSSNLYESTFYINLQNKPYKIKVNLPKHLISNVLIALHIGLYFNIQIKDIIKSLNEYKPFNMRMNLIKIKDKNIIIDDCYNSSLESLSGILKVLEKEKKQKLLIIGDINELGSYSNKIHNTIPKLLDKIPNKKVIFIGEETKKINYPNCLKFKNYKDTINYLKTKKIKDTLILIKASRSLKLENITKFFISSF